MKKVLILASTIVPLAVATAEPVAGSDASQPAAKIDVSQLPQQTKMIDEVVVPVPSEIFSVLDKLGRPRWNEVLRTNASSLKAPGEQAHTALLLGTVIAEGFIAVEAEDTAEVKNIGKSVLNLSKALGVEKEVIKRTNSIISFANSKDWNSVRRELDGALADVKGAMVKLDSESLSQLVSLGGWLRGTEALTTVVSKAYSKDGAELLHQPVLLDYFEQRVTVMKPKLKTNPVVDKVEVGLGEIKKIMNTDLTADVSEKTVKDVGDIAQRLVKAIQSKAN